MLCAGFGLASNARAQSVALDMHACSEPAESEVRAVLAVELHELLVRKDDAVPADAHVVEVRCERDTAELWLRGTSARRSVALASVPRELRARLLALSMAELARPQPRAADAATQQDVAEEPQADSREAEPEIAPLEQAPEQPPPAYFVWAGFDLQAAPLVGYGGALLFRARLRAQVAWSSALGLAQASSDIDRGELRVLSLSLRTGLALLLQSSRASLHVGAGVRGAWQRLTGEPSDAETTGGASFEAWSLGPALFAGATWQVAAPLFVALELEGAHMLREVRANVERGQPKTLSPLSATAVLGAGVAW